MIFWVDAASQRAARSSFAYIANAVGGKEVQDLDLDTKVEYARRYLRE